MSEPFNILKMITGPLTGTFWAKVVMYMLGAGCILFISFGVWRGYFKKPEPTTVSNQEAERIVNIYVQPRFGCSTIQIKRPTNEI